MQRVEEERANHRDLRYAVNSHSTPCQKELFASLWLFPTTIFGNLIGERMISLLAFEDAHPFDSGNKLLLTPYLSQLFEAGYVALRPLSLTKIEEEDAFEPHLVHFSVHWMPETMVSPNHYIGSPCSSAIANMLAESSNYQKYKNELCEIDAITKQPIKEGHECSIGHDSYSDAEDMFLLLAFRWSISMALCLAGGVGMGEDEVRTEYGLTFEEEEDRRIKRG